MIFLCRGASTGGFKSHRCKAMPVNDNQTSLPIFAMASSKDIKTAKKRATAAAIDLFGVDHRPFEAIRVRGIPDLTFRIT